MLVVDVNFPSMHTKIQSLGKGVESKGMPEDINQFVDDGSAMFTRFIISCICVLYQHTIYIYIHVYVYMYIYIYIYMFIHTSG